MNARRVIRQARWESGLLLRNGEQLLLTVIIPAGLLIGLSLTSALQPGGASLPQSLAAVLTVCVVSTAFTSLAIATAFERRSGALRFLGTTPLTRPELMGGKLVATGALTLLSSAIVAGVGLILGWRPTAVAGWTIVVLMLGVAAFAPWGVALAGLLRAEAVLAVANGLFLLLIVFGGVIIPADRLPAALGVVADVLPSGALASALSRVLVDGFLPALGDVLVLVAWLVAGTVVTARTFRWT